MKNMIVNTTNTKLHTFCKAIVLTLLAIMTVTCFPGGAVRAEAAKSAKEIAYDVFDEVNDVRAENGLEPLTWDDELTACAGVRAKELRKKFSHTRPDGRGWYTVNPDIMFGENLLYTPYDLTAEQLVQLWMDSPTHRELILKGSYETAGVYCYNKGGKDYWAFEFGYE